MGPDWKKKIRWSSEDISSAISLQSVSPKAYRYLSKKLNFPLPSISTLCRRTQVMTLRPGFIDDVFYNRIEYEPQEQRILGPHNNVQVMCARGLFSQWKQPIFFDFDCDMSVRAMGHSFDHPGPLEFIYRLKKYILGKHSSAVFSLHKNVEDDVMTNNLSTELTVNF
uniref:THAP9-like helix-turn-helix domain-containing protein n=1 Tax=Schizaphis graminum TaxID=13262 RepID=A0A2S2P2E1_SCHGA